MYATRDDIRSIYGAGFLADVTPVDGDDVDFDPDGAVDQASAGIDGYLSKKYELPLAGQPKALRRPCIDIAVYVLANSHTRLTNTIETRYKQATALLTKISKGFVGLGADEPVLLWQVPSMAPRLALISHRARGVLVEVALMGDLAVDMQLNGLERAMQAVERLVGWDRFELMDVIGRLVQLQTRTRLRTGGVGPNGELWVQNRKGSKPLYASGALHDSIDYKSGLGQVTVGSP